MTEDSNEGTGNLRSIRGRESSLALVNKSGCLACQVKANEACRKALL
jgi:hypothetical protein